MGDSLRAGSLTGGGRSPSHLLRNLWNSAKPMVFAVRFPSYWTLVPRRDPRVVSTNVNASFAQKRKPDLYGKYWGETAFQVYEPESGADMPLELAAAASRFGYSGKCTAHGLSKPVSLPSFARLRAGCRRIQRSSACTATVVPRSSRSLRGGHVFSLMARSGIAIALRNSAIYARERIALTLC